jgi:hypothetical protein
LFDTIAAEIIALADFTRCIAGAWVGCRFRAKLDPAGNYLKHGTLISISAFEFAELDSPLDQHLVALLQYWEAISERRFQATTWNHVTRSILSPVPRSV